MEPPQVAELEQHVSMLRDRVLQVAGEIKALLADDLPKFVERELKRAFVNDPSFAAGVTDDILRKLKKDVAEKSKAGADKILAALADDALWFPADSGADDERKSIDENTALWAQVNTICEVVTALHEAHGFPHEAEPAAYKPPTWFIDRRYLPSLSEKYWRHVRELSEAQGQIDNIATEESRHALSIRWDETD